MTDTTIERVVVPVFTQLRVLKLQETEVTLAPLLALLPPLPPQPPPQPLHTCGQSSLSAPPCLRCSTVHHGTAYCQWQKQKKLDADAAAAAGVAAAPEAEAEAEAKAGVVPESESESSLASGGSGGGSGGLLSLESLDLSWCDHVSRSTAVHIAASAPLLHTLKLRLMSVNDADLRRIAAG